VARSATAGMLDCIMARERGDAAEALQDVPPQEFVRARNALAARLVKEGKAGEANRIRRLRRPSPVVWALNRVAVGRPRDLGDLIDAVDQLRRAQLGQGDLRRSTERYRAAFESVVDAAGHLLHEAGTRLAPDLDRRLRSTLLAAAADRRIRADLQAGRLAEEHAGPGFTALTQGPIPAEFLRRRPTPAPEARAGSQAASLPPHEQQGPREATRPAGNPEPPAGLLPRKAERQAARAEKQRRVTRALREARQAARQAQRRAKNLEREAIRQERAAQAAEKQVEAMRKQLQQQERKSVELRAAAGAARSAHQEAQRNVQAAERREH
jgi:hypothetical protein